MDNNDLELAVALSVILMFSGFVAWLFAGWAAASATLTIGAAVVYLHLFAALLVFGGVVVLLLAAAAAGGR